MPRKRRQTPENQGQMTFDFAFQETVNTIEDLQAGLDSDEDQGDRHYDHQPNTAPGNLRTSPEPTDTRIDPPVAVVQSPRLEDSGSLGAEQPGTPQGDGASGRAATAQPAIGAASPGIDGHQQPASGQQAGSDRARDLANVGDQNGPVAPSDYAITGADSLGSGGPKSKFRDNVAAIQLLQVLHKEGRGATPDEQSTLVRYVGWGGLPQAFDHRNDAWRAEYQELASLLSQDEYERARRSTQDAHYTSTTVIDGIYEGLERLGFKGGKVLEPAAGIGNFIGLMPTEMRSNSRITAIELDPLTAQIGAHLYPSSTFINRGLQDVAIPSAYFDACVANPPFGSQSLYDPHHRELAGFSIHNYFLAKSLNTLKPGGVMGAVVSRYFLDAANSKAREHIADTAHFLGAIRLPNTAFKENALTEVTTDIVFFQKALPGDQPERRWVDVGEIRDRESGEPITINQYFIDNPEQMAGRMALTGKMRRDAADLMAEPGQDLSAAISARLQSLPAGVIRTFTGEPLDHETDGQLGKPEVDLPANTKVGSYFVTADDRLARRLPDQLAAHDYQFITPKTERAGQRIRGMIEVRDALRALMNAEQSVDPQDLETLRGRLNGLYDKYVRRFGHLSSQANRLAMGEDPEYPLLNALESNYDRGVSADMARKHGVPARNPTADKAAIFSRRVMSPREEIRHVESAKDALVVSMNQVGRVDLERMIRLCGLSEPELLRDLKGLVYFNPGKDRWETADQYLTGNVKAKLRGALRAAEHDPKFLENVEALRPIQPADIEPIDISVQLGSTWVPAKTIDDFVVHLMGDVRRRIDYQEALGKWMVNISEGDNTTMRVTWGTEAYPANKLVEAVLTNRPIQVKVEVGKDDHGHPIMQVDETQTAAANQKADEIRAAFTDWIWEDQDRRESLSRLYNDRFNTNIPSRYDGSHLQLPGTSLDITLRPHQKDAIWRGIQDGTALFDHVVGAGKTLVCVGTVMESKRMGLFRKPMVLVPNHLLLQWKDAFYDLYPNANVLVAEKTDFKKENRERLFARIATGDWDAVVVAHSSFKKIGMPPETLEELLQEQIQDLTDAILDLKSSQGDRVTIKEMEKAKERMTERLEKKADTGSKDQAVSFADLGVDALVVDEAQEFKNLFITTSLSRVSGLGNLAGSEKAFDLFVKCRYLQQRNDGRGVFLATGTPLSNTIAELYTVQRYLQYDEMKARGIIHFDAWASTFGQVVTGWELDATGVNYKLNSRFAKFQNVPELTAMYRTFADVITRKDLQDQAEARGTRFPVPKLKGGRPQNVIVDRSEAQAWYMGIQQEAIDAEGNPLLKADGSTFKTWNDGSIIHRMEHLPKDPRLDNPLKITNDARKAGLDFRLIDPGAGDFAGSKVNACVDQAFRIWQDWDDRKGTQLIFCDLSTPKGPKRPEQAAVSSEDEEEGEASISMDDILAGASSFSVYDDIRSKLLARGIPANQIRYIHEANTDLQKAKLFAEMNAGEVRIILGSTAKMGAGMNVQRRLVALHHLDAPWRPSDLEQRDGRIERQGNLFYEMDPDGFEIEILRYATKQTYDSRMWQTIEFKAAGIEQFRKGDSLQRVIEDVASEAANAAEMKAAATGNPLIFQQVQIAADLKKVEALFSNFKRGQHSLDSRIAWLRDADSRADRAIARWSSEIQRRDAGTKPEFEFSANGRPYKDADKERLAAVFATAMKRAVERRSEDTFQRAELVPVGSYRGFEIQVSCERQKIHFTVTGRDSYEPDNLVYRVDDKFSISGFISRLDNFLERLEGWRDEAESTRGRELSELNKAIQEKAKPFLQQTRLDYLREDARDVLRELKLMQADDSYQSKWEPKSVLLQGSAAPGRSKMRA
ncbi:helicase [Pseudomonas putida]|nr:helicase [Pseudomonas sp. TJI-51]KWW16046.1 helicase [Pseudomonas putida]